MTTEMTIRELTKEYKEENLEDLMRGELSTGISDIDSEFISDTYVFTVEGRSYGLGMEEFEGEERTVQEGLTIEELTPETTVKVTEFTLKNVPTWIPIK